MFRFMSIDKKKNFMNLCHKQEKRFVTLKYSALSFNMMWGVLSWEDIDTIHAVGCAELLMHTVIPAIRALNSGPGSD